MPEKGYSFKPAGAGWNFEELMWHIAYGIGWWEDNYMRGEKTAWAPPAAKGGRKAVQAALEGAYSQLAAAVDGLKLTETVVQGFYATLDHITHHRGQAVLYLRCQGIEPPEYTF